MMDPLGVRRITRRAVILASVGVLAGMITITAGAAAADYPPGSLVFHFTDCSGPTGTPATFDVAKPVGPAFTFHLIDGSGMWVIKELVDVETGATRFTMPGFEHNNLPTITCQYFSPVIFRMLRVTGLIVPVR